MYCHNCGNEIAIAMKFCPGCGSAQAPQAETPPAPPPSPAISAVDLAAEFKTRFGTQQANKMKPITFYRSAGKVLEKESRTETHIHSTGGDYTGDHRGGRYSPVSVHSTNKHIDKIWYESEDGDESWVQIVNRSAPRQGHRISAISAEVEGEDKHKIVAIINHATGEVERFDQDIVNRTDSGKGCMTLIFGLLCAIAGAFIFENQYSFGHLADLILEYLKLNNFINGGRAVAAMGGSLALLGAGIFLYGIFGGPSTKSMKTKADQHIEQIIKWCQKVGVAI